MSLMPIIQRGPEHFVEYSPEEKVLVDLYGKIYPGKILEKIGNSLYKVELGNIKKSEGQSKSISVGYIQSDFLRKLPKSSKK